MLLRRGGVCAAHGCAATERSQWMTRFAADAANALYTASSCVARQLVAMQERCAFRLLGVPVAPPIEPARRARSAESGNQTCKEMNGEKKLREPRGLAA